MSVRCPRCSSPDLEISRERKPFVDNVVCNACNYVGPLKNPNQDGKYIIRTAIDRARS